MVMTEWLSAGMKTTEAMSVAAVFVAAGMTFFLFNFFISRVVVARIIGCQTCQSDEINKKIRVYNKVSLIAALIVMLVMTLYLPHIPLLLEKSLTLSITILLIAIIAWFLLNVLDMLSSNYVTRSSRKNHSIKGYVQIGKIIISVCAIIMIIATLANKSPLIILSSFGAAAAVILLLFQHTLISLVANIQVSSTDAIQLGDWVELPHLGISGTVTELALHTTTIQNWDNTLSRVPTKYFITEHFTNWQPMFASGGRRIKRSFFVDQRSLKFTDAALVQSVNSLPAELKHPGVKDFQSAGCTHNTNLGVFRHYIEEYLRNRSDIRKDMLVMVRQLSPGPEGLPVEIYCFTSKVGWAEHEIIQSEIFEFILTVARYFQLEIYQKPSGEDIRKVYDSAFALSDAMEP